jgi:hypothetical protein
MLALYIIGGLLGYGVLGSITAALEAHLDPKHTSRDSLTIVGSAWPVFLPIQLVGMFLSEVVKAAKHLLDASKKTPIHTLGAFLVKVCQFPYKGTTKLLAATKKQPQLPKAVVKR